MDEALRFFKIYEVWIYLLLGFGGIVYLRRFILAWQELRAAVFGLERENAQSRLNQSASVLVMLLLMAVGEFVVVSFVSPMVPGASPLSTATLDLLATATTTLDSPAAEAIPGVNLTTTLLPTIQLDESRCTPGEIFLSSPRPDSEVKGDVEIRGSAQVPDFGFYKLEFATRDRPLWLTIQAGRQPKQNAVLVDNWDTSLLQPGEYILQLVIVDNKGQSLPPCRIPLRIVPPN